MSKYLITGRPGSGKTTVIQELKRLGYRAFNTDELDDVTKLQHRSTGEVVPWPKRPVDWTRFSWNWQEDTLKKLLAGDADVFIGAVVGNQKDFYGLFDKIFVLTVTLETLTQRFKTHEYKRTSEGIKRLLAAQRNN